MGRDLAGAFRIVGWIVVALGVLTGSLATWSAISNDLSLGLDGVLVPLIMIGFGAGTLYGAKVMASGKGPEFEVFGSLMFKGFGVLIVLIGIATTFNNPAGLIVIVFGAIFIGAGHLMKTLFATPEGKKRVLIPDVSHASRDADGRRVQHTSGNVIYVDEDADDAEVDEAVQDWRAERLAAREDWANKRIEGESSRSFWWRKFGPVLTGFVSIPLLIFAWFDGDWIIWLVGGIFGIVTIGGTYELIRDHLRLKAFGKSYLELDNSPGIIGETLSGKIETGIPIAKHPAAAFRLTLDCDLRWEETTGSGEDRETHRRSRRLWRDKKTARIERGPGVRHVSVPFSFRLPDDAKPTSLGSVNTGIRWTLRVEAEMKGIDFDERFVLPVVTRDMV